MVDLVSCNLGDIFGTIEIHNEFYAFRANEFSWAECYESCGSSHLSRRRGPDKALPRITSGVHIPSHLAQAG